MSPDVNFTQFSTDDLEKITGSGERVAGYIPFQTAAMVMVWRSNQFEDFLADPERMTAAFTDSEVETVGGILGHEIQVEPNSKKSG